MSQTIKLGVMGSGSGSNMQAILDAIEAGTLDAEIVLVLSDNPDGFILERARKAGIPAEVIDCGGFKTKLPDDRQSAVADQLKAAGVELVCLAGFMRLVKQPMLNIAGALGQTQGAVGNHHHSLGDTYHVTNPSSDVGADHHLPGPICRTTRGIHQQPRHGVEADPRGRVPDGQPGGRGRSLRQ